jgi:hypothetical protein
MPQPSRRFVPRRAFCPSRKSEAVGCKHSIVKVNPRSRPTTGDRACLAGARRASPATKSRCLTAAAANSVFGIVAERLEVDYHVELGRALGSKVALRDLPLVLATVWTAG